MNFWTVFAAVMGANLLTVAFVWGMYQYSRLEQEGRPGEAKMPIYIGIFMPMLFLIAGLLTSLDKVPDWLNAALR